MTEFRKRNTFLFYLNVIPETNKYKRKCKKKKQTNKRQTNKKQKKKTIKWRNSRQKKRKENKKKQTKKKQTKKKTRKLWLNFENKTLHFFFIFVLKLQ